MLGMKVIESYAMTEDGEPYEQRRTWRERMLARPWKPWKSTRTVIPQVPSKQILRTPDGLIMHPETLRQIRNETHKSPGQLMSPNA